MSHKATNWALQQRGLKPATKLVLFYLADRHNPDHGCFPSHDTLSDDCEMSPRSVSTHLDKLEDGGLILRQTSRRAHGLWGHTRYILGFEADLSQRVADIADGDGLQNLQPPIADIASDGLQNLQTNPVSITPVREPCKKEDTGVSLSDQNPEIDEVDQGISAYNITAKRTGWPIVQKINKQRRSALIARIKDAGGYEGWEYALTKAEASPFLTGRVPNKTFMASFDFLTNAANFTKLMEGNYDPRNSNQRSGNTPNGARSSGHDTMFSAFDAASDTEPHGGGSDRR